ncbi:MAG: PAS domain-containing protein [Geobacteraceae bacterium]|nr:PAS domain-containing protein [Geobacteraceae bacterium]
MRYISILMVLVGAIFLTQSFQPARVIWKSVCGRLRRKWLFILNLMTFFLLGYLFFVAVLSFNLTFPLEMVTGGVFLGGAVFVFIIINLSQSTFTALKNAEEDVKALNESLEQRVAERTQELKQMCEFNRTVLDSIADPISIIDVNTLNIVGANRAFLEELNLTEKQVIGKTCHEILHHRSSPCTPLGDTCALMETMSRDDHATAEHVHCDPYGEKCHLEVFTSPIRDESGKIVKAVHIQRNITERKRSEMELRESRELLRVVVEGTSDSVYVKDLEGRYRLFNTAAARVTGKSACEVYGRDDTFLFPADEARIVMAGDRAVMDAGKIMTYEERLTSVDGEQLVFLSTKGPLYDQHGNVSGIFGVARDITELRKAELEHLDYERKILHAQKLESLGVLAGGIAHDFNNLLTVILGNMELALMRVSGDRHASSSIEQAMQAGRHAANLTRQMLDYAGKGMFILKEVDINDVIRSNASFFRASVARTINLEMSMHQDALPIKTDEGQIQQVIMNLLINSSEAIGDGYGTITLRTGMQECDESYLNFSRLEEKPPAGRFVYVEVSDNGCGMDEETSQRIFEPFFTTKFTGRGLGMAAVLGIVRSQNGAILVNSKPGIGSTFRVLFPECSDGTAAQPIETKPVHDRVPTVFNGKILVVDDEEHVRKVCMEFAAHLGFEAIGVADGNQALKILNDHGGDIALVILDLTMPVMDGVLTFQELRRIRPDIRVLLSSGCSKEDVSERFSGDRPAGFIQKPFQMHEMKEKITHVMSGGCAVAEAA